jgi:phosphoglycolate phosphatase-like HAD superfamily hydrolase
MANKLFLFDVDGTLVTGVNDSTLSVGFTEDRFILAIRNTLGVEAKRDKDFRGLTDYLILREMLKNVGWGEQRITAAMPRLIVELDRVHATTFQPASVRLLPGVKELLVALANRGQTLGLLTGNLEAVAKRKLEALGIWSFFTVGGYGSDPHTARADLVTLAIQRAGYAGRVSDVFLIGDTPKDIEAAQDAGVENSVGVTYGFRSAEELKDAGAKITIEDFADTGKTLHLFGVDL